MNSLLARRTNDCIRNEDVEKTVAVEVELEKRRYSLAGCDRELAIAICATGHVDTISKEVEGAHDHVLRVPRKAQVKVPGEDLLLHVEEVFHQLGQHHPLERRQRKTHAQKIWKQKRG